MNIGIVGAGISGLTLGLRLQQLGMDVTVYADRAPEDLGSARLLNTVARFEHTLARERVLGMDRWSDQGSEMRWIHFSVGGDASLAFSGKSRHRIQAVDFRLLLSCFLEDFENRGGRVVIAREPTPIEVTEWSRAHDLVVVAVGRASMRELFRIDRRRSPYGVAQRRLCAGLYQGIALPDPMGLSFNVSPGAGEVFQMPIWTRCGLASSILFEAVPGGPLEPVTHARYLDDPEHYLTLVRSSAEDHAPAIADRIDGAEFDLLGPDDVLQGAVVPAVRNAWAMLPTGRLAIAIGDAWITNDPITGQGANLASQCAWLLADSIAGQRSFDERFGREVEAAMWEFAGPVTSWTNGFLQPPPAHVVELLGAAAGHHAVADAFVSGFAEPDRLAKALAAPETCDAFMREAMLAESV